MNIFQYVTLRYFCNKWYSLCNTRQFLYKIISYWVQYFSVDLYHFWITRNQSFFISGIFIHTPPNRKVHGANMGPTWVLSAPDGSHVGPMNFAIRAALISLCTLYIYTFKNHGSGSGSWIIAKKKCPDNVSCSPSDEIFFRQISLKWVVERNIIWLLLWFYTEFYHCHTGNYEHIIKYSGFGAMTLMSLKCIHDATINCMFVVNFDALAQTSDIRIERR